MVQGVPLSVESYGDAGRGYGCRGGVCCRVSQWRRRGGWRIFFDFRPYPLTTLSKSCTNHRLPLFTIACPSDCNRAESAGIPPGYFGFSSPFAFSVRQYGVISASPALAASSAAYAAIQAKIPVVIGHAIVVPCLAASAASRFSIVVNFPRGTLRIRASTSCGAGITIVPLPKRAAYLPSSLMTFGRFLSLASFSRQVFLPRSGFAGAGVFAFVFLVFISF